MISFQVFFFFGLGLQRFFFFCFLVLGLVFGVFLGLQLKLAGFRVQGCVASHVAGKNPPASATTGRLRV